MTNEEKKLLLEIDDVYNKLLQEPFGQISDGYSEKPNGYTYLRNAEVLEDRVLDLFNKFQPDYISEQDLDDFLHTGNKEVSLVRYSYVDTLKSKAANKRHTEFINAINNANKRIRLDLYSMFIEIDKIK